MTEFTDEDRAALENALKHRFFSAIAQEAVRHLIDAYDAMRQEVTGK